MVDKKKKKGGANSKVSSKKIPAPCPLTDKKVKKRVKKSITKAGIKKNPLIFQKKLVTDGSLIKKSRKTDLTRFVRWPKNIRVQRKKQILMQRLKIPPVINQFSHTLSKDQKKDLLGFLKAYRPETKAEKKARLLKQAKEALEKGKGAKEKKPVCLKQGINTVVRSIERNTAKLVIIASDVHPIELVLFFPTLCRLKNVPYCIVNGKAALGSLVHRKTALVLCLENVSKADTEKLETFCAVFREQFNENVEVRRKWGGQVLSGKSMQLVKLREKAQKIEEAKKKEISEKL